MKKHFILFFFASLLYSQSDITNISNFCNDPNSKPTYSNIVRFEEVDNLLLYFTPGLCFDTNDAKFRLWAFDGFNSPYLIKFPDGRDFESRFSIDGCDIVKIGDKVYINCDSMLLNDEGLFIFDPKVSKTHLTKVTNNNSIYGSCSRYSNIVKFNGGIIFDSGVRSNCFFNPNLNTFTSVFSDFRENNFSTGRGAFKNVEYNGNFYYVTTNDGFDSTQIKKYNSITKETSIISSIPTTFTTFPKNLFVFQNKLYYISENESRGTELFQYDGNIETCLDINPGIDSSNPSLFLVYDNILYFTCYYNSKFYLYKYNGTELVEIINKSLVPTVDTYSGLCELNGNIYLSRSYRSSKGIDTDLYSYSPSLNQFSHITTIFNFFARGESTMPQYSENFRGHLVKFNNELYIVGNVYNSSGNLGAFNDIWRINSKILNTKENQINNLSDNIYFYPNPTNDYINIVLNNVYKNVSISILNSSGQHISNQNFINLDKLNIKLPIESGVYYILLKFDNNSKIIKTIKK